jgi:hypothetical protein
MAVHLLESIPVTYAVVEAAEALRRPPKAVEAGEVDADTPHRPGGCCGGLKGPWSHGSLLTPTEGWDLLRAESQRDGESLTWEKLPGTRASRIAAYADGDVVIAEDHDKYIDWFFGTCGRIASFVPGTRRSVDQPKLIWLLITIRAMGRGR